MIWILLWSLRSQLERHNITYFESLQKVCKKKDFCITSELMDRKEFYFFTQGPVNRNIDITDDVLKHQDAKF